MGMRKLNLERNIWFYYHICWEEYVNMSYVIHIFSHLSFFQSSSLKKIHFSVLLWYFYHFIIYFCNFSSLNFTYIFKYIYTHLYIFPLPFPICLLLLLSPLLSSILIPPVEGANRQYAGIWVSHGISTIRILSNLLTKPKPWIRIMFFVFCVF